MKLNTKESKWMNRTLCENIIKNTTKKQKPTTSYNKTNHI